CGMAVSAAAPAASCRNCLRCGSFIRSPRQRGRADELAPVGRPLLCRGLRRRLPRDEFPALGCFCPGVEEHEPQAARLAVDLRLDRRAAGDECGVAREAHLAITAGRTLVLRLSRAQGGKPRRLGVGEPRGVGIEKFVVKHRLERGEIAAAHRCVALVLEGEDFLVAAHRQTSLPVSRACASSPGAFIRSFRRRTTCRSRNETLWNVRLHQSALAPENLITLAHFSVSVAMNLAKSEDEPGNTAAPRSANRAFNFGSTRPALISLLSLSTISA